MRDRASYKRKTQIRSTPIFFPKMFNDWNKLDLDIRICNIGN